MIDRGSRRIAVVVLTVVVAAVSGCSGASSSSSVPLPTPTVTTPPSTSPVPSPSPSPTLPVAAQQPTREGAEAFATYFFAVYNYALWVRDPAPLRAISDLNCVYCNSVITSVQSMRGKRTTVEGGRMYVNTAVAAPGTPEERIIVNLVVSQDPGHTLSDTGAVLGKNAGTKYGRVDIAVRWTSGHWMIQNVHILNASESQ